LSRARVAASSEEQHRANQNRQGLYLRLRAQLGVRFEPSDQCGDRAKQNQRLVNKADDLLCGRGLLGAGDLSDSKCLQNKTKERDDRPPNSYASDGVLGFFGRHLRFSGGSKAFSAVMSAGIGSLLASL